jgi:hypothetical protein
MGAGSSPALHDPALPTANSRSGLEAGWTGLKAAHGITMMSGVDGAEELGGRFVAGRIKASCETLSRTRQSFVQVNSPKDGAGWLSLTVSVGVAPSAGADRVLGGGRLFVSTQLQPGVGCPATTPAASPLQRVHRAPENETVKPACHARRLRARVKPGAHETVDKRICACNQLDILTNSASSMIFTPSVRAFSSFDPASSPAST